MLKGKLIICLIVISIIISIISIIISLINISPFTINEATYIGILITLMGIAFTGLVGYQIFNTIDIKRELEKTNILKEKLDRLLPEFTMLSVVVKAYNYYNRGMVAISNNKNEEALSLLLKSLNVFLSSGSYDKINYKEDIVILLHNINYCAIKINKDEIQSNEKIINLIKSIQKTSLYPLFSGNIKELIKKANIS